MTSIYLQSMRLTLTILFLLLIGLLFINSLSISSLLLPVNISATISDQSNYQPSTSRFDMQESSKILLEKTLIKFVKSFKNLSGFYKINGTLENQGSIILSDIKVIKYYKTPSVNDTTLICYEQKVVRCEYKAHDNQLPSKSFFLNIPDAYTKPE